MSGPSLVLKMYSDTKCIRYENYFNRLQRGISKIAKIVLHLSEYLLARRFNTT